MKYAYLENVAKAIRYSLHILSNHCFRINLSTRVDTITGETR